VTIYSGSRYEGVAFTGLKTTDGKARKFLHNRKIFSQSDIKENAIEHTVAGEETLDALAQKYYKNDRLWWLIADVNDVFFFYDVVPGQVLLIPDPEVLRQLGIQV